MALQQKEEQEKCSRSDEDHAKYVQYEQFTNIDYYKTIYAKPESCFNGESVPIGIVTYLNFTRKLEEADRKELDSLLTHMAQLTGLLLLKKKDNPEKDWEYSGTGFISKIRRQYNNQCPCPLEKHDENRGFHAILTISTAYHIFNKKDETDIKSYELCDEIWKDSDAVFKLNYNKGEDTSEYLVLEKQINDLPTLYGHQLVETDKDINFKSDWCAIECVTHDPSLIERLEATLQKYQALMTKLYKISQSSVLYKNVNLVVIIGHPHAWPKRISIGQSQCFDNVPNRTILKEIRSQQTWCRYSYDNITCHGLSGSPVFIWGQPITGFGYWFGHPHNHASQKLTEDKHLMYSLSTIGVEHVY